MNRFIINLIGFLFALTWVTGIVFLNLHLPGTYYLLYIGGTGTAFIALPLIYYTRRKQGLIQNSWVNRQWIAAMVSIMLFVVSTWMKVGHLMGATWVLILSFLFMGFTYLPLLFYNLYRNSIEKL